jgi:monoamine oxidase
MQQSDKPIIETDVVVIGAGYSGLAAALQLHGAGVDVQVCEAASRVGGRVHSEQVAGIRLDHGGQWVGPTQTALLELADRFGCMTFQTWETGRQLEIWSDGGCFDSSGPGGAEYDRVTGLLDGMARTVDVEEPWQTANFLDWDAQSAQDFFCSQTQDRDARMRLDLFVQGLWCAEPRDISLFHVLFYLAAAGGYDQLMETRGAAQDSRFCDGADAVALAVADILGDRVRLDDRVDAVHYQASGVRVDAATAVVRARRAIVAVPPPALKAIEFDPPLPAHRVGWAEANPMGRVVKLHAVYPTPFWRTAGLSGIATLYGRGPVTVMFDNSPADACHGALVGFVYGDIADEWSARTQEERREAALRCFADVVGEEALEPIAYTEKDWCRDQFVRGGYEAYATPGAWSAHARHGWREPIAALHWAGSETATKWNGYIDGAISAGYRAAQEVQWALGATALVAEKHN